MSWGSTDRIQELEAAIRKHRDQRGDDRCWVDDLELYKVLGDSDNVTPDNSLPAKDEFLRNCARFYDHRCKDGSGDGWKSYQELEKENQQLLSSTMQVVAEKDREI